MTDINATWHLSFENAAIDSRLVRRWVTHMHSRDAGFTTTPVGACCWLCELAIPNQLDALVGLGPDRSHAIPFTAPALELDARDWLAVRQQRPSLFRDALSGRSTRADVTLRSAGLVAVNARRAPT